MGALQEPYDYLGLGSVGGTVGHVDKTLMVMG